MAEARKEQNSLLEGQPQEGGRLRDTSPASAPSPAAQGRSELVFP